MWRTCGRPTLKPRLGGRAGGRGAVRVRGERGHATSCRARARAVLLGTIATRHGHPQRSRHGVGFHTRFRGIDRYCKHHRVANRALWERGRRHGSRAAGNVLRCPAYAPAVANASLHRSVTSIRRSAFRRSAFCQSGTRQRRHKARRRAVCGGACIGAIESVLKSLG